VIVLDSDEEESYFSQNLSLSAINIKEEIEDDVGKASDVETGDDDDDGSYT
jgi:hypothetical protein